MKKYSHSLFLFHRDLRLDDNTGLIEALNQSTWVIPCFILDVQQITDKNKYKSENAIQFMIESLNDLEHQLNDKNGRLFLLYGSTKTIIQDLLKDNKIDAIFSNKDYTPFSKQRDEIIKEICSKYNADFVSCDDALLNQPEQTLKKNGDPYTIFTPFYKNASQIHVPKPIKNHHKNYFTSSLKCKGNAGDETIIKNSNNNLFVHGGRSQALEKLASLDHHKQYLKERDFPSIDGTTSMSAHLKFGTCSAREMFHAIYATLGNHALLRQLYWRDFFTSIAYFFPHVFGNSFHQRYRYVAWKHDTEKFEQWCHGQTGYPIVDAGMRQLNATGYMHNRVRMIVASFLTKDLLIDWRWGEQYFATKLVDYDPAVNNGNWQWAASTGCDAQPYFRIFNPWLQQKKFDIDCLYIKKWVPELNNLTPKEIHSWERTSLSQSKYTNYPKPIVNHATESIKAKKLFRS